MLGLSFGIEHKQPNDNRRFFFSPGWAHTNSFRVRQVNAGASCRGVGPETAGPQDNKEAPTGQDGALGSHSEIELARGLWTTANQGK